MEAAPPYLCGVQMRYLDQRYADASTAAGSLRVAGGARADSVPIPVDIFNGRGSARGHERSQFAASGFTLASLTPGEQARIAEVDCRAMQENSPLLRQYYSAVESAGERGRTEPFGVCPALFAVPGTYVRCLVGITVSLTLICACNLEPPPPALLARTHARSHARTHARPHRYVRMVHHGVVSDPSQRG